MSSFLLRGPSGFRQQLLILDAEPARKPKNVVRALNRAGQLGQIREDGVHHLHFFLGVVQCALFLDSRFEHKFKVGDGLSRPVLIFLWSRGSHKYVRILASRKPEDLYSKISF